ncbi:MAG: DUF4126 family protein [Thermomicrobiales bacterium]
MRTDARTFARAATLGFAAGLRSQVPLALLAGAASRRDVADGVAAPVGWLRDKRVAAALGFAAVGELVGDKLPATPSRIAPAPLVGRMLFGGLAGGAAARFDGRSLPVGFAVGAAGAVAGSYGGYHARAWVGRETGLPDAVVAVGEDVVAVIMGIGAVRR